MGEKDIDYLFPIYEYVTKLSKENNWPFQFRLDSGHKETAIQIMENGTVMYPPVENMPFPNIIFVPDLLEWHNRIILEYEEEAKPNTGYFGAKQHKGHFEGNTRDKRRDMYYALANFRVFKIWESDRNWQKGVEEFLRKCLA